MRSAVFLLGLAGCACAAASQGATPTGEVGKEAGTPAKTSHDLGAVVSAGDDTATLIAALKAAPDEEAKLDVVRKLVPRDEKGVREALQAAVEREKDEEIKSHIVVEIAKGSNPRITELLIAIFRKGDHSLFCGPAAQALVKVPGDKMAGVLAEGLKRQYTECAAASVADALRTRKEKVVSDALLASLDDFEPAWLTARAHVFSALGGRNDPRITALLLDNLQNAEDEGVKEACARALSLEGDDAVTETLVKTLETADEFLVRDAAAVSLGIRGEARQGQQRNSIASALKKALSTEKNDRVKKDIAKALAQIEKAK